MFSKYCTQCVYHTTVYCTYYTLCALQMPLGVLGRPIRLPKETYAVPGTAVEISARCKYDVTVDCVEWSRVILIKGKEKEG